MVCACSSSRKWQTVFAEEEVSVEGACELEGRESGAAETHYCRSDIVR